MAGLHLLVVLSCLGLAAAQTPLLGWSATANVFTDTTQVRAGANLEVSDAMAHLNNIFDTVPTVVVFAQDKVTTADFARYSQTSTYSYLKNAVSNSADVLVLPSIRQADLSVAAELVEQLKQALPANGVVTDLVAADWASTANAVTSSKAPQLVIVRMPEVATAVDAAKSLQTNDNTMSRVMQDLASGKVVALFTGDFGEPATATATLRSRRAVREANNVATRTSMNVKPVSKARKTCSSWPSANYPSGTQQVGGKTCRQRSTVWGESQKQVLFGTPILMSLTVGSLMVVFFLSGTYGLMLLQTNSKYPSVDDTPIIVSTANE